MVDKLETEFGFMIYPFSLKSIVVVSGVPCAVEPPPENAKTILFD
jgi:hypothetical protein